MGNISTTFYLPSPKTFHRMLFLASKKMGWRDFEVSDNTRGVIKIKVSLETATAPHSGMGCCFDEKERTGPEAELASHTRSLVI